MGIKDLARETAGITARPVDEASDQKPRTAPVMMYDVTARMHAAEKKAEELHAALESARQGGQLRTLSLDELHEAPGRRRKLTDSQYADLKENLRHNKIIDLIKVRPRNNGGFEIVSGNNKAAILRELGVKEILCRVEDLDDAQADLEGFYANLFQTTLPEYEKYLGFKMLLEREPDLSKAELSRRSGKSKSVVSELMAFDQLPPAVHKILKNRPDLLGHRYGAQLAALTLQGKEKDVIFAVEAIAKGELDQTEAVDLVTNGPQTPVPPSSEPVEKTAETKKRTLRLRPEALTIRAGRATYCNLVRASKVMRIEFTTEAEAIEVEKTLQEILQKRADKLNEK
ncbi:ParB/RepB/Spo0J family partition protein [Massilia scottii]|uniref:ParB/RepB/Spo0J family partition protein n=1 Tax=Massilia scottii TaxID=3057166 RepID=UPI0027969AF5|nr:ParB N-terminal domain-containing protein [Massilia sp. CCM 9029]MDQ1835489.1 ParB N-terminal domain-containing protein [Massilia sp. CCM 9029]